MRGVAVKLENLTVYLRLMVRADGREKPVGPHHGHGSRDGQDRGGMAGIRGMLVLCSPGCGKQEHPKWLPLSPL